MLSNTEIREEIELGNIVIDPFVPGNLGANSYDVCLGNWFIELIEFQFGQPVFGKFFRVEDGYSVSIPVGGTLLGMTKEVAGSKYDIIPSLRTRSSIRRIGIDICASAGLGDIGYINHWTIELTSFVAKDTSRLPELIVGDRIGQIVFDRAGLPASPVYDGQYNSTDWPLCMLPKSVRHKYKDIVFTK